MNNPQQAAHTLYSIKETLTEHILENIATGNSPDSSYELVATARNKIAQISRKLEKQIIRN